MSEALTLLEDDDVAVRMPRTGYVAGHLIITARSDAMILEELDEAVLTKMYTLANRLGGVLFEALECDGTNLLIQNGVAAGQIDEAVILHVIPRWEEDGLDLSWDSTEADETMLNQVLDRLEYAQNDDENRRVQPSREDETGSVDVESDDPDVVDGSDNYYAKQFKRGLE
mgnify:CR=1 FL=1|jgi:histidine triad (HIT) family protein